MTIALSIIACLAAAPVLVAYLFLAWGASQSPGARGLSLALALAALAPGGLAGWAAWQAFAGTGGLWPALISLGLSVMLARIASGLAHGIANP
ncbi:MAG TPA: hypothetical protein VGE07_26465 [Herpetosiphonaceae bacterium]